MQYYDQHLHTYFSPDSAETFENYLRQSDLPLVTTEHLDYFSSLQQLPNVIPDFDGYSDTIRQLNEKHDQRLLKGLEAGFTYGDRHRIAEFIEGKDYDLILLSMHHNGRHGFMHLNHDTKSLSEHLQEYFSLMLEAVQNAPYANVLAHFDFGLRGYDGVEVEDLAPVEDKLTAIFKRMISNQQAFELNTRSMYRYDNAHLYDHVIGLYQSLGGKLFTVSSDAHVAADYQLRFTDAFDMLKRHGVKELAVFKNQEPRLVRVPASPVNLKIKV